MNQEEKAFIIRAYDKAELAELYSPGRTAAAALQTLYRWMRRNMLLQEELNEAGYNKFRHSFLKHEVDNHSEASGRTLGQYRFPKNLLSTLKDLVVFLKSPVVLPERSCCFLKTTGSFSPAFKLTRLRLT